MTTPARKRAHAAHMARRKADGWRTVTLMLNPAQARALDALRLPQESPPATIKRLIDRSGMDFPRD